MLNLKDLIMKSNILNGSLFFHTFFLAKWGTNQFGKHGVCVCVCVISHSTFYSFYSEAYNGSLIIYFHLLCRNEISVFMQKPTPPTYHPTHSRTLPPPDQGSDKNFLLLNSVVMFRCTYLIIYLTNCIFPLDYSFSPIRYSCSFLLFFYKAVCCKSSVSLILLIYSVFCNWGFANLCKILLTVINTEAKNILLRHIYQHAREKVSFESCIWYM
jgi:hypothetical protein